MKRSVSWMLRLLFLLIAVSAGAQPSANPPTLLDSFLALIAQPDFAYILLVIGIFGVIFELWAPGIGLPGIAGGIALLVSFTGFARLPVNWLGIVLIAFAIVLFIVDLKASTHGILTAGGLATFVLGSVFLFPPWNPPALPPSGPERVSPVAIVVMTALMALFFFFVIAKGLGAQKSPVLMSAEALRGKRGIAVTRLAPHGLVRVASEEWSARAQEGAIEQGEEVEVVRLDGVRLTVKRTPPVA
jgi:membrane-bound serine protease (ClpP class)